MSINLHVGNLAAELTEHDLLAVFQQHAEVVSASVLADPDSGASLGFGFVELATAEGAAAALAALNGADLAGQALEVSEVVVEVEASA